MRTVRPSKPTPVLKSPSHNVAPARMRVKSEDHPDNAAGAIRNFLPFLWTGFKHQIERGLGSAPKSAEATACHYYLT
jgi:hypothetical protein